MDDGWMDRYMDKQSDGCMHRCIDGWIMNGRIDGWVDAQMHEQMNRQMNECMGGWVYRAKAEWTF